MYHQSKNVLFFLQSNPVARWHICQGPINSISFSADGAYLATVGRDGIFVTRILRFFYFVDHYFNSKWRVITALIKT